MAESLLMGKEERDEMEKKLKMKKEVFDKIEVFVRHSVFYDKMLKFTGKYENRHLAAATYRLYRMCCKLNILSIPFECKTFLSDATSPDVSYHLFLGTTESVERFCTHIVHIFDYNRTLTNQCRLFTEHVLQIEILRVREIVIDFLF